MAESSPADRPRDRALQPRLIVRLTAPVIAVSGVLILVALAAAWYVRDSQRTLSTVIASNVASVQAAQET